MELQGIRVPTALACFQVNCDGKLSKETIKGRINYDVLAKQNDKKVLDFPLHYITKCYFGYASKSKSEFELLKQKHSHIVFTDRENAPDTTSTIEGTTEMYEIIACGNVEVDSNGRKGYPVISATLP